MGIPYRRWLDEAWRIPAGLDVNSEGLVFAWLIVRGILYEQAYAEPTIWLQEKY